MKNEVEVTIKNQTIKIVNYFTIRQAFNAHHSFECSFHGDVVKDKTGKDGLEKYQDWLGEKILINLNRGELEFKGIICELKFSFKEFRGALIVKGYSPTITLETAIGHYESYSDTTLAGLIKTIQGKVATDVLDWKINTTNVHVDYITQYNESYFSFLNRICAMHGEFFFYTGKELQCGTQKTAKKVQLYYPDFTELDIGIHVLPLSFSQYYYDYLGPEKRTSDAPDITLKDDLATYVYHKSKSLFKADSISPSKLEADTIEDLKLSQGIDSEAESSKLVNIKGKSKVPAIAIGNRLTVRRKFKDTGQYKEKDKIMGEFVITEINHEYGRYGEYSNTFAGVSASSKRLKVENAGFPVAQTQSARVIDSNDDLKIGRVKVRMFWQDQETTDWIQVGMFGAGKTNKGNSFIPKVGDEVIIGFKYGNPDWPFVMGSVLNVTSSTRIDSGKGLISSGGGNMLYFKDIGENSGLGLTDSKDNRIQIDTAADGIMIKSNELIKLHFHAKAVSGPDHDPNATADSFAGSDSGSNRGSDLHPEPNAINFTAYDEIRINAAKMLNITAAEMKMQVSSDFTVYTGTFNLSSGTINQKTTGKSGTGNFTLMD
jgi:type VI secretion system secreted protein VgrG